MSLKFFGYALKMIPKVIHECSAFKGLKKEIGKMVEIVEKPEDFVFTITFGVFWHFRMISHSISSAKSAFNSQNYFEFGLMIGEILGVAVYSKEALTEDQVQEIA